MRRMMIALALAAIPLAGCGAEEGPAPTSSNPLPLQFGRAGGIAFSSVELRVQPDGSASLFVRDSPEASPPSSFTLSDEELRQLAELLEANPISSFPEPGPDSGCADCFTYRLSYGGGTYKADDVTLGDEAGVVIGELGELIARHEPPPTEAR